MKKDFLILYELKNRELENAALIAIELRRRGFTVDICYIHSKQYFTNYEVILTPNLANDAEVYFVLHSAMKMAKKVILMKQEQALSENGERLGWGIPIGAAQRAHIIAWGQSMCERLIESGIDKSHIHVTGSVALDFNHSSFDSYFLSRHKICKQFGIDSTKHLHLFISSFSHCNLEEYYIEHLRLLDDATDKQIEIAEKSQKELLKWFERIISEKKDLIFIYRPHPVERVGRNVYRLEENHSNFIINKDYSIRQWIRIVDSISLWYSTSIADIAYSHKKCMVLRPYEYPKDIDEVALRDAQKIKSYDEFVNVLSKPKEITFPVRKEIIHYYFGDKFDGKSYVRLVDICEDVFKSDEEVDYSKIIKIEKKYPIKVVFIKLLCKMNEFFNVSYILPQKYKEYFNRLYNEEKGYKRLFKSYCVRLEKLGLKE